ncbi:MAG TPA: DNA polymerase I [Clostridiales bacterium]|nr:DNA polymerase I [Clostridiales bacterium]
MSNKMVLIDGHSILNRAFYGIPDLTTTKGEHTNAVLGFINIMLKIIDEEQPDYLTVAFDVHHPTFRHEMFSEYKGTRKGMPEELKEQVPIMKEVLQAMNVKIIEKAGYEADDILGTIAKNAEKEGCSVSIISGDKDLLQLASENIKIRIPKTRRGVTEVEDYFDKDVLDKYSVTPEQFIDLKGLMGDTSDNIPGVPGVGEKTATKLLLEYGTMENLYNNLDKLKPSKVTTSIIENQEIAELSKVLATIKTDCEIEYNYKDGEINNLFNDNTYEYFKRLELKSLLSRFQDEMNHQTDEGLEFGIINEYEKVEDLFSNIKSKIKTIGIYLIIEENVLYGVSVCSDKEKADLILIDNKISLEYIENKIKELLENSHEISLIGLKNTLNYIKFEDNDKVFDGSIAAYLLNPLKDTYNYDDIARDYLNLIVPSKADVIGKKKVQDVIKEEIDNLVKYSCYAALVAYLSKEKLIQLLERTEMASLFFNIEMPLIYTLYRMEQRGIGVNKEELKEYSEKLSVSIDILEAEIFDLVGEEFNIKSPKQLGIILFEKLQLPFAKKTKTGYSTAVDILDKLRSEHEVINKILEYRQLTKLKSTYADGLIAYIDNDGRIHGRFNQTITATGRISSTEPNLQNIPIKMELGRQIRKAFIPKEDYVFLDGDYSQIELRVLAHMSEDEKLIEAYKEAKDIHKITASEVFHTPFDEVTPYQRNSAKAVNFGIVYGISSFGLGQDLNISRKEAEKYINKYFSTYPRVKEFLDETVENAKLEGKVYTLFGRVRPIPEISSSNFMQRSFGERIAMNSPIQGTAADIIKLAMIAVDKKLIKLNMKSRLILQIHDELLIETHKDEVELVRNIMLEEMLKAVELSVPLTVDIKQGNSWYETI